MSGLYPDMVILRLVHIHIYVLIFDFYEACDRNGNPG